MEIVPLVYIEHRTVITARQGNQVSLNSILECVDADKKIYVLDADGIERDDPNLDLHQKLSGAHDLWVDAGPRATDDIVDLVMAGATEITIRKNLFPVEKVSNIKEVTENSIYINVDFQDERERAMVFSRWSDIEGLIVFHEKKQIEEDFRSCELLKSLCDKYKVYAVGFKEEDILYWKSLGVIGVLVDFELVQQVNKNGF